MRCCCCFAGARAQLRSGADAGPARSVNMHATLTKKFSVLIRDFQEAQTQAKMSAEERMVRGSVEQTDRERK